MTTDTTPDEGLHTMSEPMQDDVPTDTHACTNTCPAWHSDLVQALVEPVCEKDACTGAMPFVSVASNGGPHDDDSFVAGFEMGALHALLTQPREHRHVHAQLVHATNRDEAANI